MACIRKKQNKLSRLGWKDRMSFWDIRTGRMAAHRDMYRYLGSSKKLYDIALLEIRGMGGSAPSRCERDLAGMYL